MGGGGTPRQQMIGLMYLVLLAMLAMNASKDLLNAFVFLDNGINETVKSFDQANGAFYSTIDKAAAGSAAYKPVQEKANKVKAKAAEVVQMMADHKVQLISEGGFKTTEDTAKPEYKELFDMGIPLNKDNQDIGGGFYVPGGAPSADAEALKTAVDEFKDIVLDVLNNDGDPDNDFLVKKYEKLFDTSPSKSPLEPDGPEVSWASKLAEHIPLAAVTANLTLWQSYIKNAEADVIGSIASKMDGSGMVVDESKGVVQFENGYVLKGDTVKGSIFLAAYNSKAKPKIYVGIVDTNKFKNGDQYKIGPGIAAKPPMIGEYTTLKDIRKGAGSYSRSADETGTKFITGVIENKTSKGTFYTKFQSSYMVAEPMATVAATAMNVFYVGVPNPVSVSAPGVAATDIDVSAPGLTFKPGKKTGEYVVTARKATGRDGVKVSVKNKNGGTVLGTSTFRVKRLPDPVAKVLGQKEGLISKGKLKVATRVDAVMENFDFELSVTVSSFTMTVNMGGDLIEMKGNGNQLNSQMKSMLSKVNKGSRVYFENVKVRMAGETRSVPSIVFKVK